MKYLNYVVCLILSFSLLTACSSQTTETTEQKEPDAAKTAEKETSSEKPETTVNSVIETLTEIPNIKAIIGDQFITGRKWQDANGENVLVVTRLEKAVPAADAPEYEVLNRYLYAQHFVRKEGGEYTEMRKIQDLSEGGMGTNMLYLLEKSVRITDLDQDNYKEISFLYTYGVKSDASPDFMKLMMLENGEKYAIRGERILEGMDKKMVKDFDKSFEQAPKEFHDFASKLWDEFVRQKKAYDETEFPSQLKSIEFKQ